jgi:hypothetical protein
MHLVNMVNLGDRGSPNTAYNCVRSKKFDACMEFWKRNSETISIGRPSSQVELAMRW